MKAAAIVFLIPLALAAQDDKHKGLSYSSQLDKAMAYIKANNGKVGYGLIPTLFAGLAFMLDGREEFKGDFENCVQAALRGYKQEKAFNGNWFTAYSALFLSIVYLRDPRPEIKEALEDAIEVAERNAEPTGGWCHHKGFANESNYHKQGGGVDLGMLTATMLSALLIMKTGGIDVPAPLIERTMKNLGTLTRGAGISYGTNNGCGDRALSRAAAAFMGLHVAKNSSAWIYGPLAQALPGAVASTENGHAYGPVHFFAVAIAMHQLGQYAAFANQWLPTLASRQKEDGSVFTLNDGKTDGEANFTSGHRVGSTAVFAIMILLQKARLFEAPKKTSLAKPAKKEESQMIPPYVPEIPPDEPTGKPVTGGGSKE